MEKEDFSSITSELEKIISETILLIDCSLGNNPFEGLSKSLKIVQQRNYNQFISIKKKTKDIVVVLYGSQIKNEDLIIDNLNKIDFLVSRIR